jgi:hypothetical protein
MAFKAGTKTDFANSMAAAMEHAFLEEWPHVMGNQPKPKSNNQMRLLFIAIAQGILRHMVNHPDGIHITVNTNAGHNHSASTGISTTGVLY